MEVRSDPVHQQEKCNTRYEAAYGRDNPGSIFRTEAATMTPEANPNKVFCTKSGICFFIRKTQAAPKVVPAKGNNNPMISPSIILYLSFVGIIPT